MRTKLTGQTVAVLAVAFAFGLAIATVKGNGSGIREALGNTSAPWLLLPFLAGAVVARARTGRGAAVGTLVSFAALAGFYLANTWVLDLGPHSWLVDVRLTFDAGRRYFLLAAVSGPCMGAIGAWWQQRRPTGLGSVVGVAVAALLVLEPAAWLGYARLHHVTSGGSPLVWSAEMAVGLGACVYAARFSARRPLA